MFYENCGHDVSAVVRVRGTSYTRADTYMSTDGSRTVWEVLVQGIGTFSQCAVAERGHGLTYLGHFE